MSTFLEIRVLASSLYLKTSFCSGADYLEVVSTESLQNKLAHRVSKPASIEACEPATDTSTFM